MRDLYRERIEHIHPDDNNLEFVGAKGIISYGHRMVVVRRDMNAPVAAGKLDLIGGGRDPGETPRETFYREAFEEVGIDLRDAYVVHAERYLAGFVDELDNRCDVVDRQLYGVFMVARFLGTVVTPQLGNEGSEFLEMTMTEYLGRTDAWPIQQRLTRRYLEQGLGQAAPRELLTEAIL